MVLDYRTVSARHASIRFKNGEFIFMDASSSNGSYLYLRRPVELTPSQSVQFRLGRSMISMKVVNKWNRRLLRAVSRRGSYGKDVDENTSAGDDRSIGSNEDDVRISDNDGTVTRSAPRRTREEIMQSLPPPGQLSQQSRQHLDLLCALAYPRRVADKDLAAGRTSSKRAPVKIPEVVEAETKLEEEVAYVSSTARSPIPGEETTKMVDYQGALFDGRCQEKK
jgi:predicted component of type VI protein secretion system